MTNSPDPNAYELLDERARVTMYRLRVPTKDDYLLGRIGHQDAIDILARTSGEGVLWAAEIALEYALLPDNPDPRKSMDTATILFAQAEAVRARETGGVFDDIMGRSRVKSIHMPAYRRLAVDNKLPTEDMADAIYDQTLQLVMLLLGEYAVIEKWTSERAADQSGTMGEVVVDTLLQRAARKIGPRVWYPMPALFSQDRALRPGSIDKITNPSWDESVFENDSTPQVVHRIQVKGSRYDDPTKLPVDESLILVEITPDLQLRTDKRQHLPSKILRECYFESSKPVFARNLDRREEKLLEKIDDVESTH